MKGRRTGLVGLGFVALLLVSAGMASVPGGEDSVRAVRDFYTGSTAIIVVAQILGLLAAACFALFTWLLSGADGTLPAGHRALRLSGYAVALASVLTAGPVLWLCAVAGGGSASLLHRLARLSDLSDVLLFAAVAVFATCVGRVATQAWVRVLGWVVAVLTLARAILILTSSAALQLWAPLAFIVLVLALSVRILLRPDVPVTRITP